VAVPSKSSIGDVCVYNLANCLVRNDHVAMAMTPHEPVVARRRLRAELRRARKEAGPTQREVADAMEWSTAKLIRIESGEARISRNDLKALLEYYNITDSQRLAELHELARAVREEESWSDFRDLLPSDGQRYLGFEASAAVIRSYQLIVVPGQLQTERYFRAYAKFAQSREDLEARRLWELRQRRQKMHDRPSPPTMHFIIDEAVARRPVGGWDVMTEQLGALQAFARRPHVTMQILPFNAGAHEGLNYRFVLLEFEDDNEDDLVFLEEPDNELRDDPGETATYLDRFLRLSEIALPPEETVGFLDRVMAEAAREG
jgi:transcriptional regulator with XRE-family HTH domain